jgi:hypothetical protein
MTEKRSGTAFGVTRLGARATALRRRRRRAPDYRIGRAGYVLHLLGAIAMLLGMLLPLTSAGSALAAPTTDPATPAQAQEVATTSFTQVTAIGTFQGQFGCADFDPFCGGTALTNHNGIWTGAFAIAPGQYQWQVVALTQDGQQFGFGQGGPNGGPQDLTVNDGDAGTFFSFNAATQEIDAETLDAVYTLNTDLGAFALGPDGDNLSAIISTQGGGLNLELQVNGAPVGNPQFLNLSRARASSRSTRAATWSTSRRLVSAR